MPRSSATATWMPPLPWPPHKSEAKPVPRSPQSESDAIPRSDARVPTPAKSQWIPQHTGGYPRAGVGPAADAGTAHESPWRLCTGLRSRVQAMEPPGMGPITTFGSYLSFSLFIFCSRLGSSISMFALGPQWPSPLFPIGFLHFLV